MTIPTPRSLVVAGLIGVSLAGPAAAQTPTPPPVGAPPTPTVLPRPAVQAYGFTASSAVRYTVKHRVGKVVATSNRIVGSVTVADQEIGTPFALRVPLASFRGAPTRDFKAMQALGALRNPEAVLMVEKITYDWKTFVPATVAGRLDFKGKAQGSLELHGVTKPVVVDLSGWAMPLDASVNAHFTLSLADYGIKPPRWLFSPVEDRVEIDVEGIASRLVN